MNTSATIPFPLNIDLSSMIPSTGSIIQAILAVALIFVGIAFLQRAVVSVLANIRGVSIDQYYKDKKDERLYRAKYEREKKRSDYKTWKSKKGY
jgi:hypothetical protein